MKPVNRMKLMLKRREIFSASHQLYNPNLSEEKNIRIYNKCAKNHGHNYVLYVSISGDINPETEMIISYEEMKHVIKTVINRLDHECLNNLNEFKNKATTVENLVIVIYNWLKSEFPTTVTIEEIELKETEKNSVVLRKN